jgi:signal transduction histidine kinase
MLSGVLYFLASVGNLFLANLVIVRARRARGALPIALLCITLFLWDISEAAKSILKDDYWTYIRLVGSSMAPAFLWHFVLIFVRREQALRRWLRLVYAFTAVFTLVTAGALFSPVLREFVRSSTWNLLYLVALFPFLIWSLILFRARLREVGTPMERNAITFVAVGIVVGTLAGLTDLTVQLGSGIPPLGHVGSVVCTAMLAVAILRHRLLEEETPMRRALYVLLLALSGVFVIAVLYATLPGDWNAYLVVGAVAAVTALALYRFLFVRLYEQAERRKRLALIGAMAAGVAHEIRNPLASIKGAAQYVQKDLEGLEGKGEAREYLKLLVGEVDCLNDVVESFMAYARPLEPRRKEVRLEELLGDIVRLQGVSVPAGVRIETAFDPDLPPVPADPALLTQAVTNLLRNAVEAMPDGGTVTFRTRPVVTAWRTYAAIEVIDAGPGVSAGDLDRIFQPFYTTKSKGTGLGLSIARRIVEAHGGEVAVANVRPRGCKFTFLLPLPAL